MKSTTKRKTTLLAVVVAFVMSLAMAGTAFAAGNITIDTSGNEDSHEYVAYQVLKGELDDKNVLSEIKWGDGVNGDALLAALKDDSELGLVFANAVAAPDVAAVLEGFEDDSSELKKFAEIAAENLKGSGVSFTNGDKQAIASGVADGYYLIKDKAGTAFTTDTETRFILGVFGSDVAVTPKASKVEHDKEIVEDSKLDKYQKHGDYDIGQAIDFRLSATVPTNVADYKEYVTQFVDKMSSGFTFDRTSVKVYVNNGTHSDSTDSAGWIEVPAEAYTVKVPDGDNTFSVMVTKSALANKSIALNASSRIYVTYQASLNENAVIGNPGNPNESYLKYSRNPNWDGEGEPDWGETPKKYVIAFTYELDALKTGEGKDAAGLAGAEFVLYREETQGKKEYAIVSNNGMFVGWTTNEKDATTLTSPENGLVIVKGLDCSEYWLKETKAPEGYNILANPIKLVIQAEYEEGTIGYPYQIQKLTLKVDEKDPVDGDKDSGQVNTEVKNVRGSSLPSTGGMGTIIFTVVGIGVMVAAAIVLITRRRKSAANL